MKPTCQARPDAFTAAECDRILALAAPADALPGPVWNGESYQVDRARRDVASQLVARDAAHEWLFARLDVLIAEAAMAFGLTSRPIGEPVQLLRYDPGSHFAQWHSDAGYDLGTGRVVSLSVELSDPSEHEGGDLEIVPDTVGRRRTLPRGGALIFPSRAIHRVTPVTRGRRWALVAWASG
jgi:PKHD-type hydroxylase